MAKTGWQGCGIAQTQTWIILYPYVSVHVNVPEQLYCNNFISLHYLLELTAGAKAHASDDLPVSR